MRRDIWLIGGGILLVVVGSVMVREYAGVGVMLVWIGGWLFGRGHRGMGITYPPTAGYKR